MRAWPCPGNLEHFDKENPLFKGFIEKLEQHITEATSSIQVNDISTCLSMITSGIGWSVLPEICLKDREDLVRQPLTFQDGTPFTRSTFALYREEYAQLPQVKIFLERLKGAVA